MKEFIKHNIGNIIWIILIIIMSIVDNFVEGLNIFPVTATSVLIVLVISASINSVLIGEEVE